MRQAEKMRPGCPKGLLRITTGEAETHKKVGGQAIKQLVMGLYNVGGFSSRM